MFGTKITRPSVLWLALLIGAACGRNGPQEAVDETPAETVEPVAPTIIDPEPPEAARTAAPEGLHIYRLDCGEIEIADLSNYSFDGAFAGESDTLDLTCWLIRHPDGTLLWDLGLPSVLADEDLQADDLYTLSLDRTISEQLLQIGMFAADIDLISVSDSLFHRVGQVDQLSKPTWIVNDAEYETMFETTREEFTFARFADFDRLTFSDTHDVFGDGTVRIISAPGPTPGHSVLFVDLPESGPIILTGDLWYRTEERAKGEVPRINWDVATPPAGTAPGSITNASRARIEALADDTKARLVLQSEPEDLAAFPLIPEPIQ